MYEALFSSVTADFRIWAYFLCHYNFLICVFTFTYSNCFLFGTCIISISSSFEILQVGNTFYWILGETVDVYFLLLFYSEEECEVGEVKKSHNTLLRKKKKNWRGIYILCYNADYIKELQGAISSVATVFK